MSDFVVREEDGWEEITNAVDELGPIPKQELWEYAGIRNVQAAQELLDMELGDAIEEEIGMADIVDLRRVSVPALCFP